jgi:hypothetical protein
MDCGSSPQTQKKGSVPNGTDLSINSSHYELALRLQLGFEHSTWLRQMRNIFSSSLDRTWLYPAWSVRYFYLADAPNEHLAQPHNACIGTMAQSLFKRT